MSSPTRSCMATYQPPARYMPIQSGNRRGRFKARANQCPARSLRMSGRHFRSAGRVRIASCQAWAITCPRKLRKHLRTPCGNWSRCAVESSACQRKEKSPQGGQFFICGPGQTAMALPAGLTGERPVPREFCTAMYMAAVRVQDIANMKHLGYAGPL